MKNSFRLALPAFSLLAFAVFIGLVAPATGKTKAAPEATPSASAAPVPTATPEPPDKAIPRLEAKLKADPNDRDTELQLASYYLGVGRPDRSIVLTQKLLSTGNKAANVYYLDGSAFEQLGRIREATADFEQATNLEPTNIQVLLALTDIYLRTNRPADAERVAKRATLFNKDDKRAYLNFGLVLAQEKKFDAAREQFEDAAKLDPKDASGIVLEARTYLDENAIGLAQSTFERALTVDPKNTDALLGKAEVLASQHNVKEAIATFELLPPLLPDADAKAAVVDQEARTYALEKMDGDAETQYKRAISDYPAALRAHLAYGDYFASRNRMQDAEREWTAALGTNRDNREALARLGDYYVHVNRPQKAVEMVKRLTEVTPGDPSSLNALGQAYSFAQQYDRARDAYRRSFAIVRAPQALAGIAATDLQLKNYKESAQAFDLLDRDAGDFLKSNPLLYLMMGKSYAQTAQVPKAKTAYKHFLAYLKPGSSQAGEVKRLIADLDKTHANPTATVRPKKG